MVNNDFKQFIKSQEKHRAKYIGKNNENKHAINSDSEYNNRGNTDKSPGSSGRELE